MNTSSPAPAVRRPPPDDAPSAPGEGRRGTGWTRRGWLGAASGLLALGLASAVVVGSIPASPDAAAASAADELVRELRAGEAGTSARNVAVMPLRAEPAALAPLADDLRHRLGDHLRELAPERTSASPSRAAASSRTSSSAGWRSPTWRRASAL